jgi:hypothetical protein
MSLLTSERGGDQNSLDIYNNLLLKMADQTLPSFWATHVAPASIAIRRVHLMQEKEIYGDRQRSRFLIWLFDASPSTFFSDYVKREKKLREKVPAAVALAAWESLAFWVGKDKKTYLA